MTKPRGTRQTETRSAESRRLDEARDGQAAWRRWGPYLSERQWGTVREDYSPDGAAWDFFPHDHARSRAYRWGEDGLLGISDDRGLLCFGLALWNEADPILKERLFGLTGPEGNHGEDVKEQYVYLDSTPTHSSMKALYRYPQRAFPYADLVAENAGRGKDEPEYELIDTGVFDDNRFFDVVVEYAKAGADDTYIRISATNYGPEAAPFHLLPTLWFRNTWSWGRDDNRPRLCADEDNEGDPCIHATHDDLGDYRLVCAGEPDLLFTENETNTERLWGGANRSLYTKDGINDAVLHGRTAAVNPAREGTKGAAHYRFVVAPGTTETVTLRLVRADGAQALADADAVFAARRTEADAFYLPLAPDGATDDLRAVQRQAFAGLLWSKQFYYYDVGMWMEGDPAGPAPPESRKTGRNDGWQHLNNADIISMPDKWEYPWYASWDLAFHCIPLALVDPEFAKLQLTQLTREWFMHPNGQLPAYEWAFADVNPPVHAWATWRVYKIDRRITGKADRAFLERIFQKLLLNFTWWVNRKDAGGHNVFQGGFLGLDNIGVFDRSTPLPTGGRIEQSDGTAWMGMYSLTMLIIALELARENPVYEDMATKFFEHFLYIAGAMNDIAGAGIALWDEQDEFFYDVLHYPNGAMEPLKVRSLVGLIPLLAVETIEPDLLEAMPEFNSRMQWFLENRPELARLVSRWGEEGMGKRHLLALVRGHRMKRLLARMLDPNEFLSDHGVRSLSRYHRDHPYMIDVGGTAYSVRYDPGDSTSGLFGGNSNWRGPVWFPINYLLIESLQKFHHYYGDDFRIECPTGSGIFLTLREIADDLARRLTGLFMLDEHGHRPALGDNPRMTNDPSWQRYPLFYEYFHGDTGAGVGASHQTGWTALVAKLIEQGAGEAPHTPGAQFREAGHI
ncbi:MAG: glucosidase [Chloroflexota bacterium]|nr:glucosidase [Chloroflexota bacterium]